MKSKITTFFAIAAFMAMPISAQTKASKAKAKSTAKTTQQAKVDKHLAEKMAQMIEATQKIVFFDSIVVDKDEFLAQYKLLSTESGKVLPYNTLFRSNDQPNACAYVNELGNKGYYAMEDSTGGIALYTSDLVAGKWTKPRTLNGLETNEGLQLMNYPYMMADGVTLYFAAKGKESIGGYDIFVTRYDAASDTYLKPENIGMPFNSTANDYMYAVDEMNNIGYFVTDRNQTAGKVCMYMFVPSSTRMTYGDDVDEKHLQSLARLERIADTWGNGKERKSALARRAAIKSGKDEEKSASDFSFAINDKVVYKRLTEFRSPEARAKMGRLLQKKANLDNFTATIENARRHYASTPAKERKALAAKILQCEQQQEEMELSIAQMEKEIRNTENTYIKK